MSEKLSVLTAYDEKIIKELPCDDEDKAEKALATARSLADDRSKWLPAAERIEILSRAKELVRQRYDEIVKTSVMEGGKPLMDTRAEVTRAINGIQVAVEEISRLTGKEIAMNVNAASLNRMAYTFREPIGVVFAICAFNHPFNLCIHQVVTAVAVGCPVIIKPANTTPLSAITLAEILHESGLPKEWVQVLILDNEVAEKSATDKRVDYLTFIGSARVGWHLRSRLAPGTRCALEHGGSAPVIFESDADIEQALPLLAKGGFYHAGQVCVSVQRVFVNQKVTGKVTEGYLQSSGNPLDPKTDIGPLILPKEVDRVHQWVSEAVEQGGRLICGGKKLSRTCYEPTVILDPPQNVRISREEIFGPVIAVYSYKDRHEAIKLANSVPLSFQASVFTKDIDAALDTVRKIKASAVMVNDHTAFRVDWMPFRGANESGIGTGGIPYTMREMTEEKLMVIRSGVL